MSNALHIQLLQMKPYFIKHMFNLTLNVLYEKLSRKGRKKDLKHSSSLYHGLCKAYVSQAEYAKPTCKGCTDVQTFLEHLISCRPARACLARAVITHDAEAHPGEWD